MSNDNQLSAPPTPPWRRLGFATLVLFGLLHTLAFAQDEEKKDSKVTVVRAPEEAKLTISPSGTLSITIPRAPTTSSNAMLKIVNSADFALWSGPLSRSGGSWTANLNHDAVEALLVANAVKAEYPGAATGGKALQISFIREQFESALGPLAGLTGSSALFYEAPAAPAPLPVPASLDDRSNASSFAMASRRYDEQLTAYYNQLIAEHASAHALWVDLKTANRLTTWPAAAIAAQDKAYEKLAAAKASVAALKSSHRQRATAMIEQWNATHGGAEPIVFSFRDTS
jgi:hypothetical protein